MNSNKKSQKLHFVATHLIILLFVVSMIPANVSGLQDLPPICNIMPNSNEVITTAVITITATDVLANAGINTMRIYEDGNLLNTKSCYGVSTCVFTKTIVHTSSSNHAYYGVAIDNSGQSTTSETIQISFEGINNPPIITSYSPENVIVELPEQESQKFTITASDQENDPITFEWYKGPSKINGANTNSYTISENVDDNESFILVARALDNNGGVTVKGWVVTIIDSAPTINLNTYPVIDEGFTAILEANANAYDGISSVFWDYGDQTSEFGNTQSHHSYDDQGVYTISATVADLDGDEITDTFDLTVLDVQPTIISLTCPISITEGETAEFSVQAISGSDKDLISNYVWDFGDNTQTQEGQNLNEATHEFTSSSATTVSVLVHDEDGFVEDNCFVVIGDTDPQASFSYQPNNPLEHATVEFTDMSIEGYDPITNWDWNFGDGDISQEQNPTHEFTDGTWTISLTVTDSDNSQDTIQQLITVSNNPPTVAFNSDVTEGVEELTVEFECEITDGNIPYDYVISYGDGNSDNGQTDEQTIQTIHTYEEDGDYQATCTTTDMDDDTDSDIVDITVITNSPIVSLNANPNEGEEELVVDFTCDISEGNAPFSYVMTYGDTTEEVGQTEESVIEFTHNYFGGEYTATCTITDKDGDTNSDLADISVQNNAPEVSLNVTPNQGIEPLTVEYTCDGIGGNGELSYLILFDDNLAQSVENIGSYTYNQEGIYALTCAVTDIDGDTTQKNFDVDVTDSVPTNVDINYDLEFIEEMDSVLFSGTADAYDLPLSWSWDFNEDGIEDSAEQNPEYVFTQSGIFIVNLTVTDFDGSKTSTIEIIEVLDNVPTIALSVEPTTGLEPITTQISCETEVGAGNTPYTYNIKFGTTEDPQEIVTDEIQVNLEHTYDNGSFNLSCTITDVDGDFVTTSTQVNITDSTPTDLSINFNPENPVEGEEVNFIGNANAYDLPLIWSWDFNEDGVEDSTEQNPEFTVTHNDSYNVSLTVFDNDGSKEVIYTQIEISNNIPGANLISDVVEGIEPLTVEFTCEPTQDTTSPSLNYNLNFGDGNFEQINSELDSEIFTHVYNTTNDLAGSDFQEFNAFCNITDFDGDTSTSENISINVSDVDPIADFSFNPEIPAELVLVQFTDESITVDQITSWNWNINNTNNNNTSLDFNSTQNASYQFTEGTYEITLTITEPDGDQDDITKTIEVTDDAPIVTLIADPNSGIEPVNVSFICNSIGGNDPINYLLNFGLNEFNSTSNTFLSIGSPIETNQIYEEGTYEINCSATDFDGDKATDIVSIEVQDSIPIINFTFEPEVINSYQEVIFTPTVEGYDSPFTYEWSFENYPALTITDEIMKFVFNHGDIYPLTLTVTDSDGSEKTIKKDIIVPIDETAPEITNITITELTNQSVIISWTTDEIAANVINYGILNIDENTIDVELSPELNNSVKLINLTAETNYNFTIEACNSDNICSESDQLNFTTLDTLPVLMSLEVTPLEGYEPLTVNVNCTIKNAIGPITYDIEYGDNSDLFNTTNTQGLIEEFSIIKTHEYNLSEDLNSEVFDLTCSISDANDYSNSKEANIIVNDSIPTNLNFNWSVYAMDLLNEPVPQNAYVYFSSEFNSYDSPSTVMWDFNNDGIIDDFGLEEVYVFDAPGTYTVNMTVSDADLDETSITKEIEVYETNLTPPNVNSVNALPSNLIYGSDINTLIISNVNDDNYAIDNVRYEITNLNLGNQMNTLFASPIQEETCTFTVENISQEFTLNEDEIIQFEFEGQTYDLEVESIWNNFCYIEIGYYDNNNDWIWDDQDVKKDESELINGINISVSEVYDPWGPRGFCLFESEYQGETKTGWIDSYGQGLEINGFDFDVDWVDDVEKTCDFEIDQGNAEAYFEEMEIGELINFNGIKMTLLDVKGASENRWAALYQPITSGIYDVQVIANNVVNSVNDSEHTEFIVEGIGDEICTIVSQNEGAQLINLDGIDYEINLLYVNEQKVKFQINGEITPLLNTNQYFTLNDGNEIYATTTNYQPTVFGDHEAIVCLTDISHSNEGEGFPVCNGEINNLIAEGEEKNYLMNGEIISVTLDEVTEFQANFNVNGEQTELLTTQETFTLSNNGEITPLEILYQPFIGGIKSSEFCLDYNIEPSNQQLMNLLETSLEDSSLGQAINNNSYLCFEVFSEESGLHSYNAELENENNNWNINLDQEFCDGNESEDYNFRYQSIDEFQESMNNFTCNFLKQDFNNAYYLLPSKYAENGNFIFEEEQCSVYGMVWNACFTNFEKIIYDIPKCEGLGPEEIPPPVATLTTDIVFGEAPLDVTFNCSVENGTAPFNYTLNFGDGNFTELNNSVETYFEATHNFNESGNYTGVCTITDANEDNSESSTEVKVFAIGELPETLEFDLIALPNSGLNPLQVNFFANVTNGTAPYSFKWDFSYDNQDISVESTNQQQLHIYNLPGTYTAFLSVTDDSGQTSNLTKEIIVSSLERDVGVINLNYPKFDSTTYLNDTVEIDATIINNGNSEEEIEIEFLINNVVEESTLIILAGNGATKQILFNFSAGELGYQNLKVRVKTLPGETNFANQQLSYNALVWSVDDIISQATRELFFNETSINNGESFTVHLPLQNDWNAEDYAFKDLMAELVFDNESFTSNPDAIQLVDFNEGEFKVLTWNLESNTTGTFDIGANLGNNEIIIASKQVEVI
ncbi:PKD domain-containing protein [Candidatus Woesearchaeota archaeon]|mgnify:CR=1 FL=1|jgi:PKD repeat protein|nr:PKD domain-containing protein [Candidatus Woesearchaeota archaeon]